MNQDRASLSVTARPGRITAGGLVLVTASVDRLAGDFTPEWSVQGPVPLSTDDVRAVLLGAGHVEGVPVHLDPAQGENAVFATLSTESLAPGPWRVGVRLVPADDSEPEGEEPEEGDESQVQPAAPGGEGRQEGAAAASRVVAPDRVTWSEWIEVTPRPFASGDDVAVTMRRAGVNATPDLALWAAIRDSARALSYESYRTFVDAVMCGELPDDPAYRLPDGTGHRLRKVERRTALPFPNVERYRLLKVATEVFLMTHAGVDGDFSHVDLDEEGRRQNRTLLPGDLEEQWRRYLERVRAEDGTTMHVLPYLALIRRNLGDVAVVRGSDESVRICEGIIAERLTHPTFLELVWSYWHEEGYLERSIEAIARRFKNRGSARGPLAHLALDPLRGMSNLLWGREADRHHRLTVERRDDEYRAEYGLGLSGFPGGAPRGAEAHGGFVPAFHNLLRLALEFYRDDDVTTVIADGFKVLNALKETHMLLARGAHNQYGDLPWTARHEMLMDEWILDRPEIRAFLPAMPMVPVPEGWINSVQAMTALYGWTETPVVHFRDLGFFGEQLLLSIRFGNWSTVVDPDQAANWARSWRSELQQYVHAYRAVTGVDLARRTDGAAPAYHLRQRQLAHRW